MSRGFAAILLVFSIWCPKVFAKSDIDFAIDRFLSSDFGFEKIMEVYGISKDAQNLEILSRIGFVHPSSGYFYETLELSSEKVDPFKIHIRYPSNQKSIKSFPVVFVAAGVFSNLETLHLLPRRSDVIFVSFEYSFNKSLGLEILSGLDTALQSIPQQISSALYWLSLQTWTQKDELHTIGISFGSIALPLCLRVAQYQGTSIGSMIFSYGGASLPLLLDHELKGNVGHRERELIVESLSIPLKLLDPTNHLPELVSPLLLVYSKDDQVIPLSSSRDFVNLAPEPKKVVELSGPHINVDQWEVIGQFGDVVLDWYKELGTIE